MKILISEDQAKYIFGQKYICPKCKHTWEIEKKDKDPKLCHWCGWDDDEENYDDDKLLKFWKKESKKDSNNLQWIEETKKWNVSQKKIFNESVILNEVKKLLNETVLGGGGTLADIMLAIEKLALRGEIETLTDFEKQALEVFLRNEGEIGSESIGDLSKYYDETSKKLTSEGSIFMRKNSLRFVRPDYLNSAFPYLKVTISAPIPPQVITKFENFIQKFEGNVPQELEPIQKLIKGNYTSDYEFEEAVAEYIAIKNTANVDKDILKSLDELINAKQAKTTIDGTVQTLKSAPEIEKTFVKFSDKMKDKTTSYAFEDSIRKVLKDKSSKTVYETSNVESTFGGSNIFDSTKAGTSGYDDLGLEENFSKWLNEEKPNFIKDLQRGKYGNAMNVGEDGTKSWSPLNKLDTNSGDRQTLFNDYASKYFPEKNINELTESEFDEIMSKFKDDAINDPSKINDIINDGLEKYTKNILENSKVGKELEDKFEKRLIEIFPGAEVVWKGGDGNALDKTGWDMIIKKPDGTYVPIQVKKGTGDIVTKKTIEGAEGFQVYVKSNVNLKSGYLCIEDSKGNWIVFPPQQKYQLTKNVSSGDGVFEFKGKLYQKAEGQTGFQRFGTHYIDNNGNEVYFKLGDQTNIAPKELDVDIETTKLSDE